MNSDDISSVSSNLRQGDNLVSLKSNSENLRDEDKCRLNEIEEGEVEDEDTENLIADEEDRLLLEKMDEKEKKAVFKQRIEKRKALKAQLIKEKQRKNGTKNEKECRSRSTSRDNTRITSKIIIEKTDDKELLDGNVTFLILLTLTLFIIQTKNFSIHFLIYIIFFLFLNRAI